MSETPSQRAMADVDTVAEAICNAHDYREHWHQLMDAERQEYRVMAVAVISALGLTEEWSDDVAGPDWQRYRRLVTPPVAYPGPKRIAAGLA